MHIFERPSVSPPNIGSLFPRQPTRICCVPRVSLYFQTVHEGRHSHSARVVVPSREEHLLRVCAFGRSCTSVQSGRRLRDVFRESVLWREKLATSFAENPLS